MYLRLNRLGDRANLIDLQQKAVASLLLHSGGNSSRVGDSQVVTRTKISIVFITLKQKQTYPTI